MTGVKIVGFICFPSVLALCENVNSFVLDLVKYLSLHGLFITKTIFFKEQHWYYLTNGLEGKWVHAFSGNISPKVIVMEQMKFELPS